MLQLERRDMNKIDILGTTYKILTQKEEDNPKLKDHDGLCEVYSKKLIVRDMSENFKAANKAELAEIEYKNEVLRHETVHAFFHESGLSVEAGYEYDETLVDWIALNGPKIFECWKNLGIM